MHGFWTFARRMLRHRRLLVPAMIMAAISAGGLGAGLLGMLTVLKQLFPEQAQAAGQAPPPLQTLRVLGAGLSDRLHNLTGLRLPPEWIHALPDTRFTSVVWLMAVLGVLTVLGAAANFLHAYLSLTVISRTIADIRRDVFRRVVHLPLKTVLKVGTSNLTSRIIYDTATLGSGFNALLSRAVAQVTKGAAALLVALYVNVWLTVVALLVAPIVATIIRKLGKRIRRASRTALEGQAGLYQIASEALGGLRVVKVYTTERAEAGRFHRTNKAVVAQEFRVRTARALASPLVETITLFILGALVLFAVKRIDRGLLDARDVLFVLGALGVAGASLKPLTNIMNDIQQSAGAADRLAELLALDTEPGHGHKLAAIPEHSESIEFERVTLTYPGAGAPALSDVTLRIPFGQTVAFVGPNGSGKTTLLSLIPRLFDPDNGADGAGSGRVLIDGNNIRNYSVRSVRRQIAVVTQETVLFAGTIKANIAYGTESSVVTDEQIRCAARRARAEEFILQKPLGYDEPVGEDGAGLSGGQRQRIAIARAILRDPRILILDEATSMIDSGSEEKIAEAIAEFVGKSHGGRTCLIVAHRLSTVRNADRIVVMDAGRIADQGTHEELLARCEVYRQIARNQLFDRGS